MTINPASSALVEGAATGWEALCVRAAAWCGVGPEYHLVTDAECRALREGPMRDVYVRPGLAGLALFARLMALLESATADRLLDPSTPEEEVDEALRESGFDPEEIDRRGREFVAGLREAKDDGPLDLAEARRIARASHAAGERWIAAESGSEEEGAAACEMFDANRDAALMVDHLASVLEAERAKSLETVVQVRAELEGDAAHLREERDTAREAESWVRDQLRQVAASDARRIEAAETERDAARAEVDRLKADRDRALRLIEAAGASPDGGEEPGARQIIRWFEEREAEVTHLRAEVEQLRAALSQETADRVSYEHGHALQSKRVAELEDEVERMRPVVEAADRSWYRYGTEHELKAAVEAYRAATKGASS